MMVLVILVTACSIRVHAGAVEEQPTPKVPITCLLIEKASIVTKRFDEPPYGQANVGHQIGVGTRNVLSIRAWEDLADSDTSQLWKATLEFAPITAAMTLGEVKHIPVLRSYFTYGGLFWLSGGGYVWGENTIRQIDLIRTKTGFEAVVNGPIAATAALSGAPTRTKGVWRCNVIRRKVTQLDLWEGKPGTKFESFHPANTLRPVDHL
ncbi:hypothetical protein [Pseudoduganella aquatica]|uniref:hypothetical protein n=1 Tax=Pseudoduganella aquatica TaxID=2660641 RepID=UPI001E4B90BA|nr:hypothetical protein [Pseudoduganella aquatica]